MRILVGPPGSGKTQRILDHARARLGAGRSDFRLLVPTATMAEHVRNELAREGFVFRPRLIDTLSGFLNTYAQGAKQISPEALLLVVEEALRKTDVPEFRDVAGFRGFAASVARLIDELSSAGCDARRFAKLHAGGTYDAALAVIYTEVDAAVQAQGWALRGAWLQSAGACIAESGLAGIDLILLDGFFTFTDPELSVLAASSRHSEIVLTLPPWAGGEPARRALLDSGAAEERLPQVHRSAGRTLVTPPTLDREAEEIARRIIQEVSHGRLFREIGVVVRNEQPCVPALRLAFERFGIPSRFYFAEPLAAHAVARYFSLLIEGILSGWDFETCLPLFEMPLSGIGATCDGDRFVFAVRERMPDRGLDALRGAARSADARGVVVSLDALQPLEKWSGLTLSPSGWSTQLRELEHFLAGATPVAPATAQQILAWRAHSAAVAAFERCLDETAAALGAQCSMPLAEFWNECRTAMAEARLRVADHRRNVVHVMDVYEARQWELPLVFVCGLLEKQFPVYASQDPVLGDEAREHLAKADVRLATTAQRQSEERFLFELAVSRATSLTVLSYPLYNAKGEANLPSFFVADYEGGAEPAPAVRPRPARARAIERTPAIYDEYLRVWIRERHQKFSPSRVESFLQCPFQCFGRHTLALNAAPAAPRDRLDPLLQGGIVHEVVAAWRHGMSIDELFDAAFRKAAEETRLVPGHRTEAARLEMLASLRRFLAAMPESDRDVRVEQPFEVVLSDDVIVHGRIDRFEVDNARNAVVIDYKYTSDSGLADRMRAHEEGRRVQGGLYVIAVERAFDLHPVEMLYCAMRGKLAEPRGWRSEAELRAMAEQAAQLTMESAARIRDGVIRPEPADDGQCKYCEFCGGCRVETMTRTRPAAEDAE